MSDAAQTTSPKAGGDLLVRNAAIATPLGRTARTGAAMNEIHVIENGAVVIENGRITSVGTEAEVFRDTGRDPDACGLPVFDAAGRAVVPGFVDPHTHFLFAGYRADEFAWRLSGMSYMDIMRRGGGIVSTVEATRRASFPDLLAAGRQRLDALLAHGVTTVEGKSGYGLDRNTEIRQLETMKILNESHPVDVVRTFLGCHAVPREYAGRTDEFLDFMTAEVLPEVAERGLAEFCDIFCEKDVFSVEQSRRHLGRAAELGLRPKLHADEIVRIGGAELAAELGAASADHLLQASDAGIAALAASGVVATLLPLTAFCLKEPFARARFMIESGCAVALATDLNPGSSFSLSIPLVIALATLHMGLTPEEALTAITLNAAAVIGRAESIGSIEPGKQGDLTILEYPSYRFLPYHAGVNIVDTVIKNGRPVFSKAGGGYRS